MSEECWPPAVFRLAGTVLGCTAHQHAIHNAPCRFSSFSSYASLLRLIGSSCGSRRPAPVLSSSPFPSLRLTWDWHFAHRPYRPISQVDVSSAHPRSLSLCIWKPQTCPDHQHDIPRISQTSPHSAPTLQAERLPASQGHSCTGEPQGKGSGHTKAVYRARKPVHCTDLRCSSLLFQSNPLHLKD